MTSGRKYSSMRVPNYLLSLQYDQFNPLYHTIAFCANVRSRKTPQPKEKASQVPFTTTNPFPHPPAAHAQLGRFFVRCLWRYGWRMEDGG